MISPDGRWVVFTSERTGNPDLYVLDLRDNGAARPLVESDAMEDAAAFSPDGRTLIFVSTRSGNPDIFVIPFVPTSTFGGQTPLPGRDVPIIQILTQSEVEGSPRHDYRRPDSDDQNDRFRLYEAGGAPHNDLRDNPDTLGLDCTPKPVSRYPFEHVYQMALDNLIRWVDAGVAPPKAERIALNTDGTLDFDEFGNAQGGVRTSYLDIPIATYRVLGEGGGFCRLWGWEVAFSPEQLQQLYTNHEHYVSRVNARLKELVDEGFYLKEDAQVIMDEAARADVP